MDLEQLNIVISTTTDPLKKGLADVKSQINDLQTSTTKASNNMSKGLLSFKNVVKGLGLAAVFKVISGSMGEAVSRLDTLNNYANVMSNLGISSEDAEASIQVLSEKLKNVPTTLDAAALAVQRFASANGDVKASTSMFLALNNAILAGGAPMQLQKSALEQLSQAYGKGKPDMMEWRTAMQAMPAQLKQVAMAMGYVSTDQLGKALREGDVSMNEFMATISKLNKEGVAGFQSFEQQAMNSVGGVRTSFTNMMTAISRGLANIMDVIGQSNIAGFFNMIRDAIDVCMNYIAAFIKLLLTGVSLIASLFGKKIEFGPKKMKNEVKGAGSAMKNLAKSSDGASKGIKKATGNAKKLKKEIEAISSLDELHTIDKNDNSSGGSGSGGSGSGEGSGASVGGLGDIDISAFDDLAKKTSDIDKIYGKMAESIKIFKKNLGSLDFSEIKNHIKNIGTSLKDIFTDPAVTYSAGRYTRTLINTFQGVATDLVVIGKNIVEGFVGSIDLFLSQNKERIKKFIISMFNIGEGNLDLFRDISSAFSKISEVLKNKFAKQIGADIIAMFVNPIMSVTEVTGKAGVDFGRMLTKPFTDNAGKIAQTFEGVLPAIQKATGTISEAFTYVGDKMNEVYDKYIGPLFRFLGDGMSDTFSKWLDVFNKYIKPFIDSLAEDVSELWKNHLKPLVDKIGSLIGTIAEYIGAFYTNVLKPVIDWIIQYVVPVLVPIIKTTKDIVVTAVKIIIDVVGGIIDVIKGIIKFVTSVFTGNWKSAWEGIKSIFSGVFGTLFKIAKDIFGMIGKIFKNAWEVIKNAFSPATKFFKNIWEGIKNIFKNVSAWFGNMFSKAWTGVKNAFKNVGSFFGGIWNTIKGKFKDIGQKVGNTVGAAFKAAVNAVLRTIENVLNAPIKAINGMIGIINKLPKVNIKKLPTFSLPRLARGGIIDRPTLAEIGENGREVVMPLEHNTEWIDKLAFRISELQTQQTQKVEVEVTGKTQLRGNDILITYDKAKKSRGYDGGKNPSFLY